jgi:hypothetical protein
MMSCDTCEKQKQEGRHRIKIGNFRSERRKKERIYHYYYIASVEHLNKSTERPKREKYEKRGRNPEWKKKFYQSSREKIF